MNQQFATRYREREQEERAEKERLKQLVLEINERQEEEEQALIGQSDVCAECGVSFLAYRECGAFDLKRPARFRPEGNNKQI